MTLPQLIAELRESIISAIAPELNAVPFYIVELPAGWRRPIDTTAVAINGRHIALRDHLSATNEWHGWGSAIVFVDQFWDRESFLAVAIHELAHVLPARRYEELEPAATDVAQQEQFLANWVETDPNISIDVPWAGHGVDFIRRVLHLRSRLAHVGAILPLQSVAAAGDHYGLSKLEGYFWALGDEPHQLAERTYQEIQATPAPDVFTQLFARDVRAWFERKLHDIHA